MTAAYLEKMNDRQRQAVEYGVAGPSLPPPLLVIAGAGSGKTNTLAHRVAHLLVNGVHARAITFQLAEVAVAGPMVRAILAAIRRLRAPPSCA